MILNQLNKYRRISGHNNAPRYFRRYTQYTRPLRKQQ